ncbi:MAG: TIGR03032 family protein [Planctomycetota bacterium]|nr:TIGR03032 family protein [Planctomycetota bacterium]
MPMNKQDNHSDDEVTKDEPERMREVRYRHSTSFTDVLRELQSTLLISTYQAGKLVSIGVHDNALQFAFHQFDQAMGMAVGPERMAIGAKGQVWFLQNNSQIASSIAPNGRYDGCYLTRSALATGSIHCHEICWSDNELWVVNTLFSCLCTLHEDFNFVPRWQPPFIKSLAAEDRCHLNGLAMDQGRARFVTVMAESNQAAGWREAKSTTGCILDVTSGNSVTRGLAMPHSPRWYQNRLWVLNSGHGTLEVVDLKTGNRDVVARMPGYARGLAFIGPFAFIGLSRIRETAVFGGVPISEKRHELKCGIGVVDLRNGQTVATFEFESGVEEIFDVQFVQGARCTYLCGPRPDQDGAQDIWIVPRADQVDAVVARSRKTLALADSHGNGGNGAAVATQHATSALDLLRQGIELQQARRTHEALSRLQQASQLDPRSAEILNHIGNALQDVDRQADAIDAYRRSIELDSQYIPALQNLGYVLVSQGFTEEGRSHLEKALRLKPAQINRVLLSTVLPIIYSSEQHLRACRQQIVRDVKSLVDDRVELDTTDTLVPTNFFAVYQGENDRDLHANLGSVYQGPTRIDERRTPKPRARPRVGFLSE